MTSQMSNRQICPSTMLSSQISTHRQKTCRTAVKFGSSSAQAQTEEKDMTTIGFIGVGNMGGPMARNLLKGQCGVTVFDRSAGVLKPVVDAGATNGGSIKGT